MNTLKPQIFKTLHSNVILTPIRRNSSFPVPFVSATRSLTTFPVSFKPNSSEKYRRIPNKDIPIFVETFWRKSIPDQNHPISIATGITEDFRKFLLLNLNLKQETQIKPKSNQIKRELLSKFSTCRFTTYFGRRGKHSYASRPFRTMKLESAAFNALFTPELKFLDELFRKYGYELRICGGAVRDLMMGITPVDVDFSTTATPQEMQDMFNKEQIRMINVKGAEKHGTITCRVNDTENFEITTLRIDLACDGRHAEVEWTTDWYLDAERRDLTINSMYLDLDGTIYDFFSGLEDIKKRRVAFVKDPRKRIHEDYLRMLRYFRFFGRIAVDAEAHDPEIIKAMKETKDGLKTISGERIWSELKKISCGRFVGPIFKTMLVDCELGPLMGFPEQPNLDRLTDTWNRMMKLDLSWKPMTLLSALFDDSEQLEKFTIRVKYSKLERLQAEFILRYRETTAYKSEKDRGKFFQDLYLDDGAEKDPANRERVCELLKYLGELDLFKHMQKWEAPLFPVNGIQIVESGIKKGPAVRAVQQHLFQLWIDSNYTATDEELLKHVNEAEIPPPPQKQQKAQKRKQTEN